MSRNARIIASQARIDVYAFIAKSNSPDKLRMDRAVSKP